MKGTSALKTIYSIYKITNKVNEKIYIGFTGKIPEKRLAEHYRQAFNYNNKKYLYTSMRKHGKENFIFDVIYQSYDGNHTLKVMENHFITKYNSLKKGYNLTEGGKSNFGYKPSIEIRKKISKALKGRPTWNKGKKMTEKQKRKNFHHTEETKRKMSITHNGKKYPLEFGKQISERQYGKHNPNAKKVSIKGKKFNTMKEAGLFYNRTRITIREWISSKEDCFYI